ncbi:MAG: glycoside hydrolase family 88 protein [Gammaproteobacteria bacterium]|nr:glycoside hydrolase family 88 protein [Gammaproteobacteria bacterium]
MKNWTFLIAATISLAACDTASEPPAQATKTQIEIPAATAVMPEVIARLEVSNPDESARPDSLLGFTLNELGIESGPLQAWQGETPQPTQLVDDDADGAPDRLVFLADLGPASTGDYVIDRRQAESAFTARAQAEVSVKEGGEWQDRTYIGGTFRNVDHVTPPPQYTDHSEYIRYEGPGIESDEVAYRVYLDWRNGFDVFGKRKPGLVLQDVGQDGYESYHEMADWGADILKVGESLGMGGYGAWDGERAVLVSEVAERSATILSSGPIHSSLRIDYRDWNTGKETVDLSAVLSMQAGSPIVDVDLALSQPVDRLAVGIVAHPGTELLMGDLDITGEAWSYMASFGRQTLFDDDLGMVVFFKQKDLLEQTRDENSYVLVMRPRGRTLSYAFGALWSGAESGIKTREELESYLAAEAGKRTMPQRVRLKTQVSQDLDSQGPLEIARGLALSELQRRGDGLSFGGWDVVRNSPSKWSYTTGLLMEAMDDVSAATGDTQFADYARRTIDSYLEEDGTIRTYKPADYNIDNINSGKMLLRLHARYGDARYLAAIEALAAQLEDHPRTSDGAFWHKQRYPHQLWLDGVYMGMPFLAAVGELEGNDEKLEEAVGEFLVTRARLRDSETGLYYHAWDEARQQEWADPETGRSEHFWARGLGWYAMALVDILDIIPEEKADLREPLLNIITELADSLVNVQDETGTWYQVMDRPDEPGNYRESSGTAMFTYFLAKAVNRGYLPQTYSAAAEKAYRGLVDEFVALDAEGGYHLRNICATAGLGYGRDGSFRYYMSERVVENDPKGLAPAIMAMLQVSDMMN